MLNIEFTGQITGNDDEIRDGIARAAAVFASAGISAEEAAALNDKQIAETGEGAQLVWR